MIQVTQYDIHNVAVRRQISKSIKAVSRIFAPAVIVSERLALAIFDLEKVGHGQRVQLLQCRRSMANICKSRISHFCSNYHRFRDISI